MNKSRVFLKNTNKSDESFSLLVCFIVLLFYYICDKTIYVFIALVVKRKYLKYFNNEKLLK